jgi:hypothetical protein
MPIASPLKRLLLPAFFLCSTVVVQGQISVYGNVGLTAYETVQNSTTSHLSTAGGLTAGGFYNFPIASRLTAGVDVRTVVGFGSNGGDFTGAALRVGFVPHKVPLRPFFQIGGGVVTTVLKNDTIYTGTTFQNVANERLTNGAAELALGLDVRLTNRFDWRAFDYGVAAGGGSGSTKGAATAWFQTGVVYHLRSRKP